LEAVTARVLLAVVYFQVPAFLTNTANPVDVPDKTIVTPDPETAHDDTALE
jgi:hypothetical protein